jgi:hypothetical protein
MRVNRRQLLRATARLLEILGKSGYKGYVGLEYEGQDNSAAQVPGLMQKLRQVTRQVEG